MLEVGLRSARAGGMASSNGIGRKSSCSSVPIPAPFDEDLLDLHRDILPWGLAFVEIDFRGVDLRITV
jgi:hypothetical protein